MEYKATASIDKDAALKDLKSNDGAFARALRSAAMFLPADEFDEVPAASVERADSPIDWWATLGSIVTVIQARRIFPMGVMAIIGRVPNDPLTDEIREEQWSWYHVTGKRRSSYQCALSVGHHFRESPTICDCSVRGGSRRCWEHRS
jgi:hypothetical protein